MTPVADSDPLHRCTSRAGVSDQPLRLSGAQPPLGRHFARRESEPRQGLQLRLHLLPGRSHAAKRNADSSRLDGAGRPSWKPCCELVVSGDLYETPSSPDARRLRRLNDIAFSGDGEPTTYRNFDEIIAACAAVKDRLGSTDVKMVLITNASMFHRPQSSAGWRSSTPTRAKSGPSSKPAPTPITSSSSGRRSPFGRSWTTSPPRPAFDRW